MENLIINIILFYTRNYAYFAVSVIMKVAIHPIQKINLKLLAYVRKSLIMAQLTSKLNLQQLHLKQHICNDQQ